MSDNHHDANEGHPTASGTDEPKEREALSYDAASREGYAGIASTGLEDIEDVRAAKDFAEMIVDTIREGLLVLDLDLRVKAANESFYQVFQVEPENTVGRLVYDLGDGQWDLPELHELLEDILPDNKVFNDYEVEHAFEGLGRRSMLLNARRLDHHQMILLAIEDITERRQGERQLHESSERFTTIADLVPDLLWESGPSGDVSWFNDRWMEYTGQTPEEAKGWGWMEAVHPDDRDRSRANFEQALRAVEPLEHEQRIRGQDDTYRWFLVRIVPIKDDEGRVKRWYGAATDVHEQHTARETLEARVEERTRKVRELASTLTMAEQQERRRISQVLHDDLQQQLYGLRMKLQMASLDAERAEEARAHLAAADRIATKCVGITRTLTVDLSPPILGSEGLADVLDWLKVQMRDLHGLEVEIEAPHAFRTPEEDLRVLLFQLVRELLFNVAKHAGTDRAMITLRDIDHHIEITVEDEGKGFDVAAAEGQAEGGKGFGLFSVRERLGLFGGHMTIESAPGEGTRVSVDVPLQLAHQEDSASDESSSKEPSDDE